MIQNSLVAAGFLLLILADILWAKGKKAVVFLRVPGYLAVCAAIGLIALEPWSRQPLSAIFAVAASVSGALLIWSVFLEIGIEKRKRKLGPADTVVSGTYSLCRHPGFWWFTFFLVSMGALKDFSAYFPTILLMIAFDLLLIVIEDCYTFPKVFRGYDDYKKSVPFLIPRLNRGQSRRN
jgi:protein-S-isoprenylcysteine O-methyltransferase Ste14